MNEVGTQTETMCTLCTACGAHFTEDESYVQHSESSGGGSESEDVDDDYRPSRDEYSTDDDTADDLEE